MGRHFPGIAWRAIRISDEPIPNIDQAETLPGGVIGELIVRGPVVTAQYVTRTEANALHKIADGDGFWHRMACAPEFGNRCGEPARGSRPEEADGASLA